MPSPDETNAFSQFTATRQQDTCGQPLRGKKKAAQFRYRSRLLFAHLLLNRLVRFSCTILPWDAFVVLCGQS
jgi:hypothetical protein